MQKFPKLSLVLLSFNDADGVKKCLESVKKQIYPKDKIEIIIMDNGSNDGSVSVAKEYTNKVFVSYESDFKKKVIGMENRMIGMRKSKGDFIYMILEQDIELRGKYFLQKMVEPLLEDDRIIASFTRNYPKKNQPIISRYLSYNPIQLDPLLEYISVSIEDTIIEKKGEYFLCKFEIGKIPPVTHMLIRKSYVKKTPVWHQRLDRNHDTIVSLSKAGYNLFAYVPNAGLYHNHAKNIKELINKRIRNLNVHYFPYNKVIEYSWINFGSKKDIFKMTLWIVYANLFIPASIRGFLRFLKHKDWVLLLEPIITLVITDSIIMAFITNNVGRNLLSKSLSALFKE